MAMKQTRVELHRILTDILGSENVYFQPPESLKIKYPCITYSLSDIYKRNADNSMYDGTKSYTVIAIDRNPDGPIPDRLIKLPMCSFDRFYTADNLNHYVFNLYF